MLIFGYFAPKQDKAMYVCAVVLLCIVLLTFQLEAEAFHIVSGWNTVKPSAKRIPNKQSVIRTSVGMSGASNKLNSFRGGAKTVIEIHSDNEFDDAMKDAGSRLVVVDFTASWCGPCKSIAPFYQELAANEASVTFLKVDVDAVPGITARYNVNAMPTFVFIKDGKVMDKFSGASREKLTKTIEQLK